MTNDPQSSIDNPTRTAAPRDPPAYHCYLSAAYCLLLLAAGCRPAPSTAMRGVPAAPERAAPVRLTDVAAAAGVRFRHEYGTQHPLPIVETMGSGAAFLDYDNDGRPDLFLVSSGQDFRLPRQRPGCKLFHNEGNGQFTDATQAAGIAIDAYAMGCCIGDYDNDGYVDLFVSGYGRNTLLHNERGPGGGRVFRDVTPAAGLRQRPGQWGTGCAFADLDGDGWLDLYVANYVLYDPAIPLCPTARVMSGCTPAHYETQPNELYLNNRNGTFTERARECGADDPGGAGLGVVAADFDNDGRIDLFIANDGTPNALLHNETGPTHKVRFRNIGLTSGVAYGEAGTMRAGMGTDAGDFDSDGRLDLVITNFQHEPNSLYRNVGPRLFTEVTMPSGIGTPSILKLGFGVAFLDADGDGRLDLYVGNGHVFDNVAQFDDTASYAQTDQLYLNQGDGHFADVSRSAGPAFQTAGVARGVAVGDYDNNGTPDVLVNSSGLPARLLKTEWSHPNAWVGFVLRGTRSNRSAIGARVEVRTPAGLQVREVRSGSSYLSQPDLRPLFGLGSVTRPDQVRVTLRWPSGLTQQVPLEALNRYVTLVEGRAPGHHGPISPEAAHQGPAPASGTSTAPAVAVTPPTQVEAAVATRPADYELRMNAAQYYMTRGQNAAAIPHLEAAARLQPRIALPWIALGDARMLAGQEAPARAAYVRAQKLAPGEPLIDRGLGQLLIREGRLEAARALLAQAVSRHPDSVDLRLALGNLYLVLNQPALAVQVLQPAADAAPASADVHYLLGQAHERNLHIQAALREQQAAVGADPTFVEAYGRIGLYLIDLTRYAEARPPLQQAIRLNPREPHYYWALGDSYLLDTSDPGNIGRAIDLYHQALGVDPRNEKVLMSLGLALTRRGDPGDLEEAVRVLARLLRQNPAHTNALYKLYETSARLGRTAAARQALARFRALESRGRRQTAQRYQTVSFVDTASAHLRLGRRYLAEGRAGLAAAEFRLALERDPHLEAARAGLSQAQHGQPGKG